MDEKKTCEKCCGECSHCSCHHWHGGNMMKFGVFRVVLGIILFALVFSFGMKIGEIKGQLEYGYGMNSRHTQGVYGVQGGPMMGGTNYGYGMMQ